MFTVVQQIGIIITGAFSVLQSIIDFGYWHLAPVINMFYLAHDKGIEFISPALTGVAGVSFTAMLVRFLWNALRGSGA